LTLFVRATTASTPAFQDSCQVPGRAILFDFKILNALKTPPERKNTPTHRRCRNNVQNFFSSNRTGRRTLIATRNEDCEQTRRAFQDARS
jgi:hypothetical protein